MCRGSHTQRSAHIQSFPQIALEPQPGESQLISCHDMTKCKVLFRTLHFKHGRRECLPSFVHGLFDPFGLVLITGFWGEKTSTMVDDQRFWTLDSAHDYSRGLTSGEFWFPRVHRRHLNHLILETNLELHWSHMHKRYHSAGSLAINQNLFMYSLKIQIPGLHLSPKESKHSREKTRFFFFPNKYHGRLLLGTTGRIESHEERKSWIPNLATKLSYEPKLSHFSGPQLKMCADLCVWLPLLVGISEISNVPLPESNIAIICIRNPKILSLLLSNSSRKLSQENVPKYG